MSVVVKRIIIMVIALKVIWCLQCLVQRPTLTYYNEKYFVWANITYKRYGRRSPYYFNMEGRVRYTLNNNVTVHIEFFEYLHNEYRRSFVEVHYPLCDFLTKSRFIGKVLAEHGLTCPVIPSEIHLTNITFPTERFPNIFPFETGRVYVTVSGTDSGEILGKGHVDVVFKNEPPKKAKH